MIVNVANDYGTDISSRSSAAALRSRIERESLQERVTLDFANVRTLSDSFADEAFAVLVVQKGECWFKSNVSVIDVDSFVRRSILSAIHERICTSA